MKTTLVLATRNLAKVRELAAILAEPSLEVRSVSELLPPEFEVEETGVTFEENAWLKAEAICGETKLPALADDSGIEVDALDGRPGVYSARYAGPRATDAENNARLLAELEGVPFERRTARFVCALALAFPKPEGGIERVAVFRETIDGRIGPTPRGDAGFGYDPLFECFEFRGKTTAEISLEEKNRISHRGRALAKIRPILVARLGCVEAAGSV